MKLDKVDEARKLIRVARKLRELLPSYREAISDRSCDKHGIGFGVDGRFPVFKSEVSFDAYTGYYGNSGCSTFGGLGCESPFVAPLLVAALNANMEAILNSMADEADRRASQIKGECTRELEEAQKELLAMGDEP